jgi:D-threo-aldose 1-dehydrogenase
VEGIAILSHLPPRVAPNKPIKMPKFGFGAAPIGDLFIETPEAEVQLALDTAWELGVRYYDTAPWYGHGLSEHRLGRLLRQHEREAYYISTKVGRVYKPVPRGQEKRIQWLGGQNFEVTYDYSASGLATSYAQSQLRLGQSSIDALIIHDLDQGYHGKKFETYHKQLRKSGLSYLHDLKSSGEISSIGMGINALVDFEFFAERVDLDFFLVAMPYTLLDQKSLNTAMKKCIERGIRIVLGSPFASGLLTNPKNPIARYNYGPVPDDIRARAIGLQECCEEFNVPLMAAALQFPLFHPAVCSIIPGARTAEQITGNIENFNFDIPKELWAEMKARDLIVYDAPIE